MSFWKRLFGGGKPASEPVERVLAQPDWVSLDLEEETVKVRLFLSPSDDLPALYELELPDGDIEDGAETKMRCFSPPPEGGGGAGGGSVPTKAWTVPLRAESLRELQSMAGDITLFPVGRPAPSEGSATVELSLASGQAEARIRWWMNPPSQWGAVDRFVARLTELAKPAPGL